MRLHEIALLTTLICTPLLANTAHASVKIGVAASVNGEMISHLDIDRLVNITLKQRNIDPKSENIAEIREDLRSQVLNQIILDKILFQDAKKNGINITDAQVDAEIENTMEKAGLTPEEFEAQIVSSGNSLQSYRRLLQNSLTKQAFIARVLSRKIIVSDEDVLEFYQENGGTILKNVQVALLVYPDSETSDRYSIDLEYKKEDFSDFAKKYSVGPNAETGGDMGMMVNADLALPIQKAIEGLQAGDVSSVFRLGASDAQVKVIKMESIEDASDAMDENIRANIEQRLRTQKGQELYETYIAQLKEKAIIDIKD